MSETLIQAAGSGDVDNGTTDPGEILGHLDPRVAEVVMAATVEGSGPEAPFGSA